MFITSVCRTLLWMMLCLIMTVRAEFLDLSTTPLQTTGSSDVLPNLMFVLDNSGSMGFDYTPDWSNSSRAIFFKNASYNTQYYNPNISYSPPLNYLGNSMGNQTSFTAVENAVDDTGAASGGTTNLVGSADYFAYVAGEFCTTPNLTSCTISRVATGSFIYPAEVRWCNSSAAASARTLSGSMRCQRIRNNVTTVNETSNTFTNLRQPRATYRLTLNVSSGSVGVSSIKINNIEILSSAVNATSSATLASNIRSNICTSNLTGACQINGNTVSISSNVLTITTQIGDPINTSSPIQVTMSGNGSFTALQVTPSSSDIPGSLVYVNINSSIASYTSPGSTAKHVERTDCASTTCTYAEEMTNFANWHAYYRTRMRAMKTAASQAFRALDSRYRVGFVTINSPSSNYLAISPFNTTQKQNWYKKLFAANPSGSTPLRTALANVGRHFAGKKTLGTDDPVQYACQSNFSLLTTDGYWNDSTNPLKIDGTAIGNQDGGATPRPLFDSVGALNTLSDTAKYYYSTDIRDSDFSNCTGGLGSSVCGTTEDYPTQNMVTLTLGLGISGTLAFTDDYKTQTVGDYVDLKSGAKNWPNPSAENGTRIDDLWHAAVNAGGTYYSASNPKLLRESLAKGLAEIKSLQGSSAAAAASSLSPVNGDNYQFVASYKTVKWTGNLEARTVNVNTLTTSEQAVWCVENVSADSCVSPATEYTGGDGKTYCKSADSTQSLCDSAGGTLGSILGFGESASCYVEIAKSCTGKLQAQVQANNRNIYFNAGGSLTPFQPGNLTAAHITSLTNGYLALSQMQGLSSSDPKLTDANKLNKMVDFLRGNKTYEDTSSNSVAANRLFREREATLGDISQSRPNYYKQSNAIYLDAGYTNYKNSRASILPAIYVGANDGMLHAFNANTGNELWAFIPTPVIANLSNLADKEYGATFHTNYVNGNPIVADICIASCNSGSASWRTILVSGLNGGGRGYFAIDVTDPTSPSLLWEFTAKENTGNLGYTFGNPVFTKLSDGRWVVLLTSGYNNGNYASKKSDGTFVTNAPVGDGVGYLYVLNAYNGSVIRTLSTGSGSASSPSGLSKIAGFAENMFENNTATKVYGGDLNGDVWRFDINSGAVSNVARLTEASGVAQKITTQPELGKINDNIVVMVGTGKFLEAADLTNTPQNSVYTFKDNNQTSAIGRGQLIAQTLSSSRTVSPSVVNFNNTYGWYLDFPIGERVTVDPMLLSGVLLMPTLVPNSASCSGSGYGWFNFFNYKNGGSLLQSGIVSERMTTPAVGYNVIYDNATNTPHVVVTGSNDPTSRQLKLDDDIFKQTGNGSLGEIFKQKTNGSYGTKQSWRELIQ